MWLLSTSRAELHYFPDTRSLPGGYAILSHTWTEFEQTFQEAHDICTECKQFGGNPRHFVRDKIRRCCELSECDGYKWVWIDSCCIDKSSSTELSEAINSMFDWYILAEVCYVYLEDVDKDPKEDPKEFLAARWHTRGWTLQELLAPELLVFLSADWSIIGTKQSLCSSVSEATGIPVRYLTRELDMFEAPVGQRMSWASKRRTTRVEDEAYSLLGIFGINTPTLYGEGRRAFQRLQLEIVKQSQDTTLFAWGSHDDENIHYPVNRSTILSQPLFYAGTNRFLLARSPSDYVGASNNCYTPPLRHSGIIQPYIPSRWSEKRTPDVADTESTGSLGDIELPAFKATASGMECRFPVGEIDGITIAVLLVERGDQHIGLFLRPAPEDEALNHARSLYYTSWLFNDREFHERFGSSRLVYLGSDIYNLRLRGKPFHPSWRTIYIRTGCDGPSDRTDVAWSIFRNALVHESFPLFCYRVSRSVINGMSALGMEFKSLSLPQAQVWYIFSHPKTMEQINIMVGVCSTPRKHCAWAYVLERHPQTMRYSMEHVGHVCTTDHLENWPGGIRIFGEEPEQRQIALWYSNCPHDYWAIVFNLQLGGYAYRRMMRQVNITFPSPPPVITAETPPTTIQHDFDISLRYSPMTHVFAPDSQKRSPSPEAPPVRSTFRPKIKPKKASSRRKNSPLKSGRSSSKPPTHFKPLLSLWRRARAKSSQALES